MSEVHRPDWRDESESPEVGSSNEGVRVVDEPSTAARIVILEPTPSTSTRAVQPLSASENEESDAEEPPEKHPRMSKRVASSSPAKQPPRMSKRVALSSSAKQPPRMSKRVAPLSSAKQPPKPEEVEAKPLNKVIKFLADHPNREEITTVRETVTVSRLLNKRVHLPALTNFELTIKLPSSPPRPSFKAIMKSKLANLEDIIFYNKEEEIERPILQSLMSSGVSNIQISFLDPKCFIFNLNESTVLMHLVKDAQTILNSAAGSPIKALYLSEIELHTLDPIRTDLLKEIVIRKVDGLRNHGEFLKKCPNLQSICWNRFGGEVLLINELTWTLKGLKKLAVAEANLQFTLFEVLTGPRPTGKLGDNAITELYMDKCTWDLDWFDMMGVLFPHLKKIYISGKEVHSSLLINILAVPTIQWIFLWEMTFAFSIVGRGKKKELLPESKNVLEFLGAVFGMKMDVKKAYTFLLEKNMNGATPNPSARAEATAQGPPLDASAWHGQIFNGAKQYEMANEIDFEVFGYDQFYDSFKAFNDTERRNK